MYLSTHPGFILYLSTHPGFILYLSTHPGYILYLSTYPGFILYLSTHPGYMLYLSTRPGYSLYATIWIHSKSIFAEFSRHKCFFLQKRCFTRGLSFKMREFFKTEYAFLTRNVYMLTRKRTSRPSVLFTRMIHFNF